MGKEVMLSIRLEKSIERNIEEIANQMNLKKATIMREAITRYVDEQMDYLASVKVLKEIEIAKQNGIKTEYSLSEINETFKNDILD